MKDNSGLSNKLRLDRLEHKEALRKYYQSLISEIKTKWTDTELRDMLMLDMWDSDTKSIDNILNFLISTDSSNIDCLLCDYEDMPLFINDYEPTTCLIAKYRLKSGK